MYDETNSNNSRWILLTDEYKNLLEIFEACNDERVFEIQVRLSKHLKELSSDKDGNKNN